MDGFSIRREQDVQKLHQLSSDYNNIIEIIQVSANLSVLRLKLNVPTSKNKEYPSVIQPSTEIQIDLPARYPLEEPKAKVLTPIWNPNIFANGTICLGTKWLPTQGLDLLVERILKLIIYDPLIVNENSPANAGAKSWYLEARGRHPSAFPTTNIQTLKKAHPSSKMTWTNLDTKISVSCPRCCAKLQVISTAKNIKCPSCANIFRV